MGSLVSGSMAPDRSVHDLFEPPNSLKKNILTGKTIDEANTYLDSRGYDNYVCDRRYKDFRPNRIRVIVNYDGIIMEVEAFG